MFVCERGIKIRKRFTILFDSASHAIQATEAVYLLHVSQACCFQRPTQDGKRFIIGLERYWKWMTILASMREGKSRRVRKATWRSMHDLGNERERLKRSRPQSFDEKKAREVTEFLLVRESKHRSQPFQVDILGAHVMMAGHYQSAGFVQRIRNRFLGDREQGALRFRRAGIDEVEDLSLRLAKDRSVRIGHEITNRCRMPMVPPRGMILRIHPLLHNRPFSRFRDDKGVQVKLEAIAHGVVVHACSEPARPRKRVSVESGF